MSFKNCQLKNKMLVQMGLSSIIILEASQKMFSHHKSLVSLLGSPEGVEKMILVFIVRCDN